MKCPNCNAAMEKDWQYVGVFTCGACKRRFKAANKPQPRWQTGILLGLVAAYIAIDFAQTTTAYKSAAQPVNFLGITTDLHTLADGASYAIILLVLLGGIWSLLKHRKVLRELADNEVL